MTREEWVKVLLCASLHDTKDAILLEARLEDAGLYVKHRKVKQICAKIVVSRHPHRTMPNTFEVFNYKYGILEPYSIATFSSIEDCLNYLQAKYPNLHYYSSDWLE